MRKLKEKICCCLLMSILALPGISLPQYLPTMLPLPDLKYLTDGDQDSIKEALSLEVYQDHKDPNQYYYMPPFHIRQYKQGAASMMLHAHNVKQFAEANGEMERREHYDFDRLQQFQIEIENHRKQIQIAQEKYELALEKGIKEIVELRKDMLDTEKSLLDKRMLEAEKAQIVANGGTILPKGIAKNFNERIVTKLSAAGFKVPYNHKEDPDVTFTNLQYYLSEASSSYGGFLSLNTYAGFTRKQLDSLVTYKRKYAPNIKISLLPIDELNFFALTEWQLKPDSTDGTKFFRKVDGSGGYLGASIVLDTTLGGSLGLAQHMAPFIVPVGIKAKFKQQLLPTEAELICDFSAGFTVKGRADVRDGLVIFDNDITNTIKTSDESTGACNINHISGDPDSAHFAALKELEATFESMRVRRTVLAYEEKQRYYQNVLADIDNNRRQNEPTYTRTIRQFSEYGWVDIVIEGLTRAADFHWHTNIQDVANMSKVKFTKRVSITGHTAASKKLPINFCLVFNSRINAYDRCTPEEELKAKNMNDSMLDAQKTAQCANIVDPFECGRQRDLAGLTANRDHMVPPEDDNLIMSTIR